MADGEICKPASQAQVSLLLADHDATARLGGVIADCVKDHAVIALIGPLGAGKTTLVQGLAKALGVKETVNSPTFTMMNEYHSGRLPLYHLDLYRLSEETDSVSNVADLLATELDQFIDREMIAVFEWADLFQSKSDSKSYFLQLDHVVVNLDYVEEVKPSKAVRKKIPSFYMEKGRKAILSGFGEQAAALIWDVKGSLDGMFINS